MRLLAVFGNWYRAYSAPIFRDWLVEPERHLAQPLSLRRPAMTNSAAGFTGNIPEHYDEGKAG
jgi:hypothetical protein